MKTEKYRCLSTSMCKHTNVFGGEKSVWSSHRCSRQNSNAACNDSFANCRTIVSNPVSICPPDLYLYKHTSFMVSFQHSIDLIACASLTAHRKISCRNARKYAELHAKTKLGCGAAPATAVARPLLRQSSATLQRN